MVGKARKKGIRKKGAAKSKLVKPLPKMKIVVKSTKTISFDENFDEDDSENEEQEESADEMSADEGGVGSKVVELARRQDNGDDNDEAKVNDDD